MVIDYAAKVIIALQCVEGRGGERKKNRRINANST
jgi:hypothetical protein